MGGDGRPFLLYPRAMINKEPVFAWFVESGDVMITVDPHDDRLDIPPHLRGADPVNFVLGVTPSPHMGYDGWGVTAPMRFAGNLYTCRFPWSAIMQMSSENAVIQFRTAQTAAAPPPRQTPDRKKKPTLRVVK